MFSFLRKSRPAPAAVTTTPAADDVPVCSERCFQVGERLTALLAAVNSAVPSHRMKVSQLAEAIGQSHSETLEGYFAKQAEPSFQLLDTISGFLGASAEWVKHGVGHMFPVREARIPEGPESGVRWLLDLDCDEPVSVLHLVRSNDETGSFLVVKQYGAWRCRTYLTPYHVSAAIGAGGEAQLAALSVTLELLYAYYTKRPNVAVRGYLVSREKFDALLSGDVHPLSLLKLQGVDSSTWWEDFWDDNQFPKHDYWTGWKDIARQIFDVVAAKPYLKAERELIINRQHPLLA